jgi:purine-nucleoside phosphorylase
MTRFKTLFGIKESDIKDTCVLMPLLPKGALNKLGVKNLFRGKIYSSGNANHLTLINTGMGAALAGDAVVYLSETRCKNIILFGSCGLVTASARLDIGSLVMPIESYSMESFTGLLLKDQAFKAFYPDKTLMESFLKAAADVQKVRCATLGSLKLEEENMPLFRGKNIDVVDMECSACFSAAGHRHLKAIALFYVSDILDEKPFYENLSREDEIKLTSSIESAAQYICSFAK